MCVPVHRPELRFERGYAVPSPSTPTVRRILDRRTESASSAWREDPSIDMGLSNPNSGTSRKDIERVWPGLRIVIHIKGGLWIKSKRASE